MKFVIVVLAIVLLGWLLFGRGRRSDGASPPRRAPGPAQVEGMVRCAHCDVHLPASEALRSGALHYCSDVHQARGPRAPHS